MTRGGRLFYLVGVVAEDLVDRRIVLVYIIVGVGMRGLICLKRITLDRIIIGGGDRVVAEGVVEDYLNAVVILVVGTVRDSFVS